MVKPNDVYTLTGSMYKEFNRAFVTVGGVLQSEIFSTDQTSNYNRASYHGAGGFWFSPFSTLSAMEYSHLRARKPERRQTIFAPGPALVQPSSVSSRERFITANKGPKLMAAAALAATSMAAILSLYQTPT